MRDAGTPTTGRERHALRRVYGDLANVTVGEMRAHRDGRAMPMRGTSSRSERAMCDRLIAIQRKRGSELTEQDYELMARAISRIHLLLRHRPEGPIRCSAWRRRLLLLGHDPLRTERSPALAAEH